MKKISDNVKGGIYGAQISESDCAKAKEIGEELFRIGGMELLEKVSAFMERECPHTVQIRDQLWDGVGEWHYSSEQWSDY